MKIVLIGYMASGKSFVGKKLAAVLGIPFKDLDAEIENQEGKSIPKIFSEKGEIYFRKVENEALKQIISKAEDFVLATGGGTHCYGNSMDLILSQKDVLSIYLKTPLDVLVARLLSEKENRPVVAHLDTEEKLNDFIRKHLFERSYYYNQAALIIDNGNESVNDTVEKIILKLF